MRNGLSRAVIENVQPTVDGGRFPAKRVVGDSVSIEADVFADGHDLVAAEAWHRPSSSAEWQKSQMEPLVNDRWRANFTIDSLEDWRFKVVGWIDHFGTWKYDLRKRIDAGQDVAVDLQIGADLVQAATAGANDRDQERLEDYESQLRAAPTNHEVLAITSSAELSQLMFRAGGSGPNLSHSPEFSLSVDRVRASFGAWYEMFPRSAADEPRHGTLQDVEARLPYVAAMGFDILYLPPIHPIGRSHRKGKNNSPTAEPDDVGSPWAIGAEEGGHKSIHPDLGTFEDFERLLAACKKHKIELAMDIAFQCAPDHPYVHEHPEWFRKRPDGSIQYAENPPKKYQDIYPFDFESPAWQSLWQELKSIFDFWIDKGVNVFRVDNPHTKPFPFWEWVIGEIRNQHGDVIFLAEAFTRPKIMYRLAKLGFSQSYTYFSWRDTKPELTKYFTELTRSEVREFFRPNLWPNTPDILPESLQVGGQAAFRGRLVLAATLAGNYGIYGPPFEHGWSAPREPGSEEYLNSEKYQVCHHDIDRPDSLRDFIARVNKIRRASPALEHGSTLDFHPADNEQIICYSRMSPDESDILLVVVSLDFYHRQSGWVELPAELVERSDGRPYQMHDLLTDARYMWHGNCNYIELDPATCPAHIFKLRLRSRSERDFEYFF